MSKTFFIGEDRRGLVVEDGRLVDILDPGTHSMRGWHNRAIDIVSAQGIFDSPWATIIEKFHPDLVARYFEIVRPEGRKLAIVSADGHPRWIVPAGQSLMVWKVFETISVTIVDPIAHPMIPQDELPALRGCRVVGRETDFNIGDYVVFQSHVGLLAIDHLGDEVLPPGKYAFWQIWQSIMVQNVDTRLTPIEVTAQEILTRDRVSVRVTLTCYTQVIDARLMTRSVSDHQAYIYKLVQFAVREAIGSRTLDEVLNDRTAVDEQIAAHIGDAPAAIGVAMTQLGIKDIILPGEMRELLNRVVEAEKVAQANLIRRREETAATRSLLNTAKLMEDNPVLMRLKELETLERITEKIGRIDIQASNGEGLNAVLDRLVHLRPQT